ncbi:MAG: glycosyltransferase family 9 protein [Deltaproteobacteria bacterium]|nr:glycosyltransferase family 9 protein [Deltaproteobacteria bacterium]
MKRTYVLKRSLMKALIQTVDAIGSLAVRRSPVPPLSPSQIENVLFIRLDQIGDIVTTLPAIDSLKTLFPNAEITGLAGTEGAELLYGHSGIDRLIILHEHWLRRDSHRKLFTPELKKLLPQLKEISFDIGIDFRGDLRNILLMKWIGVKYTIGYGATGGGWLLDSEIPYDPNLHAVKKSLQCLSPFSPSTPLPLTVPRIDFHSFTSAQETFHWLKQQWNLSSPFIAAHPTAGTPSKEWPLENWLYLVQKLLSERNEPIVLVGGDRKKSGNIVSALSNERLIDASGMTNLRELAVLLSQAKLFISCDSGPAHIAAAVGTPTLVIASGTNVPSVWLPTHPHVKVISHAVDCSPCEMSICPKEHHWCMEGITVMKVLEEAESLTGRGAKK